MLANQPPTLDFGLGDEVDMLRDTVRAFAADRIAPIAAEIDRTDEFPRHLWPEMGALGLHGITVEEEHGGSGMGYVAHCVAMEEVSRASASVGLSYGAHSNLCVNHIRRCGSEDQKRRYLPSDLRRASRRARLATRRRLGRGSGLTLRPGSAAAATAERHQDVDHHAHYANPGGLCQDRPRGRPARHHAFIVERGFRGFTLRRI